MGSGPGADRDSGAGPEPVAEPGSAPVADLGSAPVAADPGSRPVADRVPGAGPEPVADAGPEPVASRVPQAGPDRLPEAVAAAIAASLVARPFFCDLLAQAPLNLERNVSLDAAAAFKEVALGEVATLAAALGDLLGLTATRATDVVATATGMAGALWQMAAPGTQLRELYETRPELAHAVVDVEPTLVRILTALLRGMRESGRGTV
ncbi:hypothetical protein ACFRI7_36160 [Streptomyces sp. NPDC056716]|uniref:hypothetical protein n=1 Tax=unclassified Streptomyces TaxID=2593676 RepID=UPI003678275D